MLPVALPEQICVQNAAQSGRQFDAPDQRCAHWSTIVTSIGYTTELKTSTTAADSNVLEMALTVLLGYMPEQD